MCVKKKIKIEEKESPLKSVMDSTLENLKTIVDVSTIVGDPIKNDSGVIILPISKISVGFVAGGGDYATKALKKKVKMPFAGGSGAGVSVSPMGFLVISNNIPNFIKVENRGGLDKLCEILPEILDKYTKNKGQKNGKSK